MLSSELLLLLPIQYWNICCIKFYNKAWLNCSIKKYLYFIIYFSYGIRLLLVETIPPIPPGGGIVFTSCESVKSIPTPPLQKNKVNHINKIIMTKLSLMHPYLFSKKNQFMLRIWFSWSIAIDLQLLA